MPTGSGETGDDEADGYGSWGWLERQPWSRLLTPQKNDNSPIPS